MKYRYWVTVRKRLGTTDFFDRLKLDDEKKHCQSILDKSIINSGIDVDAGIVNVKSRESLIMSAGDASEDPFGAAPFHLPGRKKLPLTGVDGGN